MGRPRNFDLVKPAWLMVGLSLILSSLIYMACDGNHSTSNQKIFDAIVEPILEKNGLMNSDRFTYRRVEETQQRHYVVRYLIGDGTVKANDSTHWIATVSVAKAGEFIDFDEHASKKIQFHSGVKKDNATRYVDVDYVNVAFSYAPRGMFSGMIVTTSDNRFDVRVMASDLLPDGVKSPVFDHEKIGEMILKRYAEKKE